MLLQHRSTATHETACPLDCPDSCSLAVTVSDGRISKINGSHRHDVTAGFICAKVRRFHERVYGDRRLRVPGVRTGAKGAGTFAQVSWDEALDLIATRFQDVSRHWGGEAILPFCYGGSNGLLSQDTSDAELFRRLGASRLARTVCAAPTGAATQAMYGKMPGVTYQDYVHARLIVIWGANPSTSGIHLLPFVREARRRGAELVVIDPRRTALARQADLHLQVRPGTDLVVALAVHRHLFEQGLAAERFLADHARGVEELRAAAAPWTVERAAEIAGISQDGLASLATRYARLSPAVIRCGWGVERNRNGGHAALAILALPAVAGKFGVRGGGYSMSNSAAWGLSASSWIRADEAPTRVVNMNQLGRALTEFDRPPVKLLFVYNCNPVATMPDQNRVIEGLRREDLFTVVFEQVMNDTARFADVVLPATTFLETWDLARSYGPISLQLGVPVIEPTGEARANVEVFSELARRLGVSCDDVAESDSTALLRVLERMPEPVRTDLLERGTATPPTGHDPVQFVDVLPRTGDGKIDLYPAELATSAGRLYTYQPDPGSAEYPLALISPASRKTISSTLGELRTRPAGLRMNPVDAAVRGLAHGDTVRVYNQLGEVHSLLVIDPTLKRGTVCLPKGLWSHHTFNGATANALVPDSLTDLGGGACFNDARVEVTRLIAANLGGQDLALWTR
jgi:anaerobic selenocysteine-containing dehydrogenase